MFKPKLINPSDTMLSCLIKLKKLPNNRAITTINSMSLEESLYDSKKFFEEFYKLHNVILYDENLLKLRKKVNPLSLPIKLIKDNKNYFNGSLIVNTSSLIHPHTSFVEIRINEKISELTSCTYAHEITHTQLESHKGSYTNFYNSEVLSKFNSLFIAYLLDPDTEKLLKIYDSINIHEMAISALELHNFFNGTENYPYEYLLQGTIYLLSDLQATTLFSKFYQSSDSQKQDIIDNIQQVFDNQITVEKLLNKNNITISDESFKQLTKYYRRASKK